MLTKPAKELILKPSKWGQRNRWFTIGPVRVYLRNTTRCIEAAEHQCLDVASIDVVDEGKGPRQQNLWVNSPGSGSLPNV